MFNTLSATALLVVVAVGLPAAPGHAYRNEADGFEGLPWGSPPGAIVRARKGLQHRYRAGAVNAALRDGGVPLLSVVATMLRRMLDAGGEGYPSTVRAVLLGGGPAPRELLQAAHDRAGSAVTRRHQSACACVVCVAVVTYRKGATDAIVKHVEESYGDMMQRLADCTTTNTNLRR